MRWGRHISRVAVLILGVLWTAYLLYDVRTIFAGFSSNPLYNFSVFILCLMPLFVCSIPLLMILTRKVKKLEETSKS
jgi:hypothetical protein